MCSLHNDHTVLTVHLPPMSLQIGFQGELLFAKITGKISLAIVDELVTGEIASLQETFFAQSALEQLRQNVNLDI